MGAVYLAEHPLIGKKVALKVIHRELANNKEVVQRFFQEAKAVTKIGNEHIVEIHDFGQTPEGDHFYIMEYLEGETLAGVLAKETCLHVMRALHIGAQIAAALAAAHAAGVIHRDLKPDNVMLTLRLGDPNFVVLLDFGLAKMFVGAGQSAVKTAAGVLLGTPQYMSPEACESKGNLDHRTDIYALGILLFQMTTGILPFDGETMGEVLVKQVTQLPPPPRGYNPSIPPAVEQIILRCLAKNVDARFPTMIALREALLDPEQYLRMSPPIAPARSLAPGEAKIDAKTVMAYAAAVQETKIGHNTGPQLPLPAPAPTQQGDKGLKTLMHDGSMVPPRTHPQHEQPHPHPHSHPHPQHRRPQAPPAPEMVAPAQPKMNTMRIATPLGYSSRPPRKMWPIVLVLALLLGLAGGAFAVAWFGRKGSSNASTGSAAATGSSAGTSPSGAAGSGASPSGAAGSGASPSGVAGSGASPSGAAGSGASPLGAAGSGASTGAPGASAPSGAAGSGVSTGASGAGASPSGAGTGSTSPGSAGSTPGASGPAGSTPGASGSAGSAPGASGAGSSGTSAGTRPANGRPGSVPGNGQPGSNASGPGSGQAGVGSGASGPKTGQPAGGQPGTGQTKGSGVAPAGSGSPPAGSGSKVATAKTAVIVIDSTPQGAEVFGSNKQSLGKTPLHLTLPISDLPQTFDLRLTGYKKKTKQIVVTGNAVIPVPLDKLVAPNPAHKKGPKNNDGLMRPDDL